MSDTQPSQPVVVTAREVEKILSGKEAVDNIDAAANEDSTASALERAAILGGLGHVLREIRHAENKAGAVVLTTPQLGTASRLQSLIASGEAADVSFVELATGGLEAKFDTRDWFGWATVAWAKLKNPHPHPIIRPKKAEALAFPDAGRVGVIGDWGSGLYGAPEIAKAIRRDPDPYAMMLHLGDVYYSGTENEVQQRFLSLWPQRKEAIHRAINSNHEMYSGGFPYFQKILPKFDQEASYFAYQNKNWTLIGLDVAYKDHDIDDEQVEWLKAILSKAGDRKVVLFSHHQLYSHFESQGAKLWGHPEFGKILRSKRIFAWYWGHEHRCTVFEGADSNFGILARCIGHGGMPESRDSSRDLPRAGEPAYSRAEWRRSKARPVAGNALPDVAVLEGPNPLIIGEEDKFLPHGYAVLTFDGPHLKEQILDPTGAVIYEKNL